MKHLVVCEYGTFLGLDSHRLAVRQQKETRFYPLNRLCTVAIAKRGVAFSSDLVEAFSERGIKLFFLDFRGVAHSALVGEAQHGVVAMRMAQMDAVRRDPLPLARRIVVCKIKNQRAALNYFWKYHRNDALAKAAAELEAMAVRAGTAGRLDSLLGCEGAAAASYFGALREARLFCSSFARREGRGSVEITNSLLNLGYAVMSCYLLNAVINAGLEPYLGVMHQVRPGKMALVLDLMEEYRAWVVDRCVIKLRQQCEGRARMTPEIKKALIGDVQRTCARKYVYRGKRLKLEHIMQRQVYRLCGYFYDGTPYKPYLFKW